MQVELRLPDLDLPNVPAIAGAWNARVGQRVAEGERLIEVVAGDVAIELAAPASGVLVEQCVKQNQTLELNQVLARIQTD